MLDPESCAKALEDLATKIRAGEIRVHDFEGQNEIITEPAVSGAYMTNRLTGMFDFRLSGQRKIEPK